MIKKLLPSGFLGGLIRRISGRGATPAATDPVDDALAAPEDDPLAESAARAAYRRSHGAVEPPTLPGTARRATLPADAAPAAASATRAPRRSRDDGAAPQDDRSTRKRPAPGGDPLVGPDGIPRAPRIYSGRDLGIDVRQIPTYATRVALTLHDAGYAAYIVGGAVRDLLSGANPKDFDVATDATPEQVHAVFRRSRIIGRRFQIVHVGFGREIVEVSTFRALTPPAEAEDPTGEVAEAEPAAQSTESHGHESQGGRRRERRQAPVAQTRAVDEHGRLTRDNVFGEQWEDAARRDFTINAMFYDPSDETVLDYHGGVDDIRARRLRIIGDATTRYREDPVRMLRAVRFAAKLGFELDARTAAPIAELADLVTNVPQARLFDEMLKLLFCGNAADAIHRLRGAGLHRGLLPLLDSTDASDAAERFVGLALASTDARVKADKPTSPGFLFAALLWPDVNALWKAHMDGSRGEILAAIPALFAAADEVLATQFERFAIQRRFVADMKEIWSLQPRFERRNGRNPFRLLEQPRFRAGYDFYLLRAEAGELPMALADWWTAFADADSAGREDLIEQAAAEERAGGGPAAPAAKKRRRKKPAVREAGDLGEPAADADGEAEEDVRFTRPAPEADADTATAPAAETTESATEAGDTPDAPRKRRRRRSPRKAGSPLDAAAADIAPAGGDTPD
ncbi:polynucleotide adenylyltransferase PcnB [Derxia lacustris]|uniref:polynucleotide adenylyltransferase PcnB n=1 Tax=Derxia lacustris TaxID=764842 RepID=UPI000A16D30A|nr:polynucleotide adenylyltransferase PcnB [Derxia lacustris]